MTHAGGNDGYGIIFSVGTNGTNYRSLLSFTGTFGAANGKYPYGSLTLSGTRLYGTTLDGGIGGYGNVFGVGTNGANYQNLISFTGTGGSASGNVQYTNLTLSGTRLYGMTINGGIGGYGNVFSVGTNGANYQNVITFTGTGGTASGDWPYGSLTLSGTTFYGMTLDGGVDGYRWGNIFSFGIDGSNYQDLYDFTGGTDGAYPHGDLTLSGGTLFGMTSEGGIAPGANG